MQYPAGYEKSLLSYTDAKGNKVSALPFETDDTYYLIRMTVQDAKRLIKEDEDYDDDGQLREDFAGAADEEKVEVDEEVQGSDEDMEEFGHDDDGGEDDHIIVTRRSRDDDEDDMADDGEY